ncbi:FAD-dependent monooxygenase [Subtercola endophyticus]|nr:FAD-dependent monooxygenase [Subtercola endophyticus]
MKKVLVIGGGVTGTVAAAALAQRGVEVTLIEIYPRWSRAGHGITVHGNALLALQSIGVAEAVISRGVPFNNIVIGDAGGAIVAVVPTPHTGGAALPATLGTLRSDLQAVLVERIDELGVDVRLGTTATSFTDTGDAVEVQFSTGDRDSYDLVVAADGIKSSTREYLGIPERQAPSGMGIWRFVTARTPEMSSSAVYYGGPHFKAGYAPISETECYAYVLTDPQLVVGERTDTEMLSELLASYHGVWDHVRSGVDADTFVNYQPIEWLNVEGPWHRGRVIAIGDAVHACPPLIAQGAAMCAEDAVLLAEYVTRDGDIDVLLAEFEARRKPRVKTVVDSSMKMVDWELHPDLPDSDAPGLMASSLQLISAPA